MAFTFAAFSYIVALREAFKKNPEIYRSFTNRGYPPPPFSEDWLFPFFSSAIILRGVVIIWKKIYSLVTCFGAYRTFLSYKCFFPWEKNVNILVGGYPPPSIGKRPIYFRFFLLKASLTHFIKTIDYK